MCFSVYHTRRTAMTNPTRLLARFQQIPTLFSYTNIIGRRSISVSSFLRAEENSNQGGTTEEEQQKQPDASAHSFGEGYATRADEEGFGGTCESALDANEASIKLQQDKMIHEHHPVYDKTQGSEVAETEKGRNQKDPC